MPLLPPTKSFMIGIYDLNEGVPCLFRPRVDKLVAIGLFFFVVYLDQPIVILSRHLDINVVVPWDVSLVPNGTDERSVREIIAKAVLVTKGRNVEENIQRDPFFALQVRLHF